MSGPSINGVSLLTLLEDDALISAGSPVLTLLQTLQAAQGDPIKEALAWGSFQAALLPSLLTFNSVLQGQLLGVLAGKVTAALAKAQTGVAALSAAPLPSVAAPLPGPTTA